MKNQFMIPVPTQIWPTSDPPKKQEIYYYYFFKAEGYGIYYLWC